jgi:ribosomal protein S17|tara:strand:+ start:412 stop:687 length:276 start_codon:yes stop_codon:yes gene_type:complete
MSNLQEVLEFIKNSEKSELKSIYDAYAIRMSELKNDIKNTFRIGDIVGIDHKKISSSENFRIYKINNKNIKVVSSRDNSEYTVSPGLLVKR